MSVGFGLATIRASRERGHRDGRWQARRLHLFQPRLRGGRRRFPGGNRPPTPGPPCSVSRRQHRAVGAPQSGHPQRLVGSSWFSKSRRPCWPGGRLPSPSSKRTSTTVRVSAQIRFSERPPGLRRIFSPFTRPLSDLLASFTYAVSLPIASFTYAVSLPTVDEGPAISAGTSLMRGIQSVTRYLAIDVSDKSPGGVCGPNWTNRKHLAQLLIVTKVRARTMSLGG
jgi:hypothetical protein